VKTIKSLKAKVDLSEGGDEVQILGSYSDPKLKYPSDIDFHQQITDASAETFIKRLRMALRNVMKSKNLYFSDFKAGIYRGRALKWSLSEIFKGVKTVEAEGGTRTVQLKEAIDGEKSIIKLDLIVLFKSRYKSATINYFLLNEEHNLNTAPKFAGDLINIYLFQFTNLRGTNDIKALKRLHLVLKIMLSEGENPELREIDRNIVSFLNSGTARLAYNNENLEILIELIEKYPNSLVPSKINENVRVIASTTLNPRLNSSLSELSISPERDSHTPFIKKAQKIIEASEPRVNAMAIVFIKKYSSDVSDIFRRREVNKLRKE